MNSDSKTEPPKAAVPATGHVDLSSINELYDLFYVAAYGYNRQCEEEIRKVFYAHDRPLPVHLFFEFFATQPLPKNAPPQWSEEEGGEASCSFSQVDFVDLRPLVNKLKSGADQVSKFLKQQLTGPTKQALEKYQDSDSELGPLQEALMEDLNRVIPKKNLYDATHFSNVALRQKTKELIEKKPVEADAIRHCNRLLLEDAYPREILRERWLKHIYLLTPFAPRLAQHSIQAPKVKDGRVVSAYRACTPSEDSNGMLTWALRFDLSKAVKAIYERWKSNASPDIPKQRHAPFAKGGKQKTQEITWDQVRDQATGEEHYCGFFKQCSWDIIRKTYQEGMENDPVSYQYSQALKELLRPLMSGDETKGKNVFGLMVPICSSRLFYGAIWVFLPGLNGGGKDEQFQQDLALRLLNLVNRTYVPGLAILHEHLLEKKSATWFNKKTGEFTKFDLPVKFEVEGTKEGEKGLPGNMPVNDCRQHNAFYLLPDPRDSKHAGAVRLIKTKEIADDIETLLQKLWQRRADPDVWRDEKYFENSLIFKTYLITSESMVRLLHRVICAGKSLRKMNDTLPACLVIGGAGSGKEKLAKMVRLFSDDCMKDGKNDAGYHKGKEFVVNLASIRPAPLTAAVISGVDLTSIFGGVLPGILKRQHDTPGSYSFSTDDCLDLPTLARRLQGQESDAIFMHLSSKVLDPTKAALQMYQGNSNPELLRGVLVLALNQLVGGGSIYDANAFAAVRQRSEATRLIASDPKGDDRRRLNRWLLEDAFPNELQKYEQPPPTLRLDEFNSMDPDSQGVLLRFLDDSQVVGLGAISEAFDKDRTNCLVIGIMNEDPEEISREKAMEFMKNPYLGGLLGDVLYEHFMKIRRLRPDVMYRMMRNGKFEIPALAQRSEDIPLLFYFFVKQELDANNGVGAAVKTQDQSEAKGQAEGEEKKKKKERLILPLEVLDRLTERDLGWPGNVRQLQALSKYVAHHAAKKRLAAGLGWIVTLDILEEALVEVGLVAQKASGRPTVRGS